MTLKSGAATLANFEGMVYNVWLCEASARVSLSFVLDSLLYIGASDPLLLCSKYRPDFENGIV